MHPYIWLEFLQDFLNIAWLMNDPVRKFRVLHFLNPDFRFIAQDKQYIMFHHQTVCHSNAVIDMPHPQLYVTIASK